MLNNERIQIWNETSNQITFDTLFVRKTVENGQKNDLANFRQFLAIKGVKCYSTWIMMPDLESSDHLASLKIPFVIIFRFWNFWPPLLSLDKKMRAGAQISRENVNFDDHIVISVTNWIRWGGETRRFQKVLSTNRTTLVHSPPFPLMLTYGPLVDKAKAEASTRLFSRHSEGTTCNLLFLTICVHLISEHLYLSVPVLPCNGTKSISAQRRHSPAKTTSKRTEHKVHCVITRCGLSLLRLVRRLIAWNL